MNLQEFAKEILPVVQAASEGRCVQYKKDGSEWKVKDALGWYPDNQYRIKPSPTYRPYTREEFVEKCLGKPLRVDGSNALVAVVPVRLHANDLWDLGPGGCQWDLSDAFYKFTHIDGSPCGMIEEA